MARPARRWLGLVLALPLALALPGAALGGDGGAVALVNGHPISRGELIDVLIDAHGVDALQQLIILQVARQEAKRRGLRVRQADIAAELDAALARIAKSAGMNGEYASQKNKQAALKQVLKERRISMREFMIGMERNAYLRKIVQKDIHITEETLREEFARTHGERVQVRHIQIGQRHTQALNEALELLKRGADFADVARQLSENPKTAPRGGLMEAFAFDDPNVPAALRETAFSLKVGGVSEPVLTGQFFHILKLERRIPTDGVRFEDVREQVERDVRQRAMLPAMRKLAVDLFKQAKIRVLDSKLRGKYQEFLNEGATPQPTP